MYKPFSTIISAAFLMLSIGAYSQAMKSDHWSPNELLERAKHLKQQAAQGDGSASETLEKYPHHYTRLAFRSHDGGGELHQNFADLFYILDGRASVITGGEVLAPVSAGPGETRGSSVKGGERQELKAGDVVHIPAGTPHQMMVAAGDTITYFVVKIEEKH